MLKIEHKKLQRKNIMDWYLIQTKNNAHMIARDNLKNQDFEVFLPLVLKTVRKAKKFVTKEIPLFPGYILIGSKMENVPWNSVNATRGVVKAVSFDGKYRPIDEKIVKALKLRCDPNNVIDPSCNIKVGDQVKIQNGPFSEFICEVEKIDSNKRVWLLIEIMKQKITSEINLVDICYVN